MSNKKETFTNRIILFSVEKPKFLLSIAVIITAIVIALAALPSIYPQTFPYLNGLKVDTDPENMLPHDEPARLFHDRMKKALSIHEIIGVGVINEEHENGIFNVKTLSKIYTLTEYAKTLTWTDDKGKQVGVITAEILAPSTVDNIEQKGPGTVSMNILMSSAPQSESEASQIREKALKQPHLQGLMFSENQKALALSLPITSKDVSYQIYKKLQEKIKSLEGEGDQFHIAGLPVAEDVFGVEMFIQMGIAAPISMAVIFILMLLFFRKLTLVISPMIVAMISVFLTMGLLIISGNTVHIMSSMIAIFIMPIAVLDSVHILSDFFDEYQEIKDRKKTLIKVMQSLYTPMFFTSLTTMAGFASLVLTPIPPVQVFGIFVSLGVAFAWLLTILLIPAYIMLMSEKSLENFGAQKGDSQTGILNTFLRVTSGWVYFKSKMVMAIVIVVLVGSAIGITKIVINDNPTRWFKKNHPIRQADIEMNKHLGGTYISFLTLESKEKVVTVSSIHNELTRKYKGSIVEPLLQSSAQTVREYFSELEDKVDEILETEEAPELESLLDDIDSWKRDMETFKNPKLLTYIEKLQRHLETLEVVGKTSSVSDIVKVVHRELFSSDQKYYTIPDKFNTIGQTLSVFQSGHRPDDLWKFVTPSYKTANIWIQMKSGNNVDMQQVLDHVNKFIKDNPPPVSLEHNWFGLTYINLIWQGKMVTGMLKAFLGSFVIVLIMMIVLFRSVLWGILSMIPLSVTIVFIYGIVGFVGKEYDMPVAVLSSLSLGLAIDYAIHLLARSRAIRLRSKTWREALTLVFEEPARAITRNVFVVGIGFLPLLLSPLVPYNTVGILIAAILISAGVASVIILPSLITILEKFLFPKSKVSE